VLHSPHAGPKVDPIIALGTIIAAPGHEEVNIASIFLLTFERAAVSRILLDIDELVSLSVFQQNIIVPVEA